MTTALRATLDVTGDEVIVPFLHDPVVFPGATGRANVTVYLSGHGSLEVSAKSAAALLAFFRNAVAAVEPLVPAEPKRVQVTWHPDTLRFALGRLIETRDELDAMTEGSAALVSMDASRNRLAVVAARLAGTNVLPVAIDALRSLVPAEAEVAG